MNFPKARLVVSAVLFVSWLGVLLFLKLTSASVILSRPQFMLAQVYVIADVQGSTDKLEAEVTVAEVLWPKSGEEKLVGQKIKLPELEIYDAKQGNAGPDRYLLALQRVKGSFAIAPVPHGAQAHIYRWEAGTKAQIDEIITAKLKQ
jgi:hypothetical protein